MGGLGSHVPPTGAVSVLDLRPDGECSKRAQSSGYGLFAWAAGATLPGSAIPLGDGYIAEIVISGTMRNNIKTALGMATPPSGNTLADVFLDGVLGDQADPTGTTGPRPIDFTTELDRELWLANHSRVAFRAYDPAQMFAANPKGVHSHLRDLMRDQVRKADAINPQLGEKVLGALLMKCGVSRDEVKNGAPNRKADAQKLMPPEWSNGKKNGTQVREPKTQLVELWPNNGAVTSQTYTWAQETSAPWASSGAAVSANKLGNTSNGTSFHGIRCTTPVSSADHWSTGQIRVNGDYQAHLMTRVANGAATCYFGGFVSSGGFRLNFLSKYVAGAGTTLGTGPNITPTLLPTPTTGTARSNGSTQSFELTGFTTLSVTDTSVTGNLYGGAGTSDAANNYTNYVGPVTIDDGLSAAAGGGGVGAAMLLDMI